MTYKDPIRTAFKDVLKIIKAGRPFEKIKPLTGWRFSKD